METTDKNPKQSHYQGVLIGVPTFGMISVEWFKAQSTMAMHIFTNWVYMPVQGKPVDIARNEIVQAALDNNFGYVFFRDDDTIAPRDALLKMMKRFPMNERTSPGTEGNMVIGGVVYSKTEPPAPMIFKDGTTGGFEDWQPGDLVKCDVIGMGCTMIPTAVFRKTLQFVKHYRCVNDLCDDRYEVEREPVEGSKCPTCESRLVPDWFKTVRDVDDDGMPAIQTEDTYFLVKCKKAGIPVYCDTSVLCEHEIFDANPRLTTWFGYSPNIGGRWMRDGLVYFHPDVDKDAEIKADEAKRRNGNLRKNGKRVKFNLGSGLGAEMQKGYINVDLQPGTDFQCDVRNLAPLTKEYGQADEIRAHHVWEHLLANESVGALREWLKALKPGKMLHIEVPDLEWACKNFINVMGNGKAAKDDLHEMIIYGRQLRPGDEHKTGFYEKKVRKIIAACRNQIESYDIQCVKPKNHNQGVIKIKIRKVKV